MEPNEKDQVQGVSDQPNNTAGQLGRELSFGEKAMGVSFNPSGDTDVQKIKGLYAELADAINDLRTQYGPGEKGRLLSVALTELQGSQMFAVKGITWQD